MTRALVVGAGPAGLAAAEVMAEAGLSVTIAEQMPSPGRKFLMAGKSGLNLTKDVDLDDLVAQTHSELRPMLAAFDAAAVQAWANGLGQEVFTGSSGRVFPKAMKASPLLRAWLARLEASGVTLRRRWRWTGFDGGLTFETPEGQVVETPDVTIMACGGASWRRLGSDGAWADHLPNVPFKPANMGLRVEWSPHMAKQFGAALKDVALIAGDRHRGEFVISARGLEGGGIYAVSRAVREGAPLLLDLKPDLTEEAVRARLEKAGSKTSLANRLRKAGLAPVQIALLQEFGRPLPNDLAPLIKSLPVRHDGPAPLDEAISVAGGVPFSALDQGLMLRDRSGIFCAGEMLDWEAPTGGYLLTACLATGRWAGQAAVDYCRAIAR